MSKTYVFSYDLWKWWAWADMLNVGKANTGFVGPDDFEHDGFSRQYAESKFPKEDHIFSSGTWPKKPVQNG